MRLKRFRKTAFCQKYCSPLKAGAMRLKSVKKKRRLIGAVQRIRLPVKSALLTLCLAYILCGPICQSNYGRRSRRPFIRALRALEKSLKSRRIARDAMAKTRRKKNGNAAVYCWICVTGRSAFYLEPIQKL